MLPYFDQPAWHIGPLTIHAFGITVACAMWIGMTIGQRRFDTLGPDPRFGQRLGWWIVLGGFLGAHLFSVFFYFPGKLRHDPWLVLRVWEDISSFGGLLGGAIGGWLFFELRATEDERRSRLAYLDAAAYAFPVALAIGRLGCALAHDHPGRLTRFPLAISVQSDAAFKLIREAYTSAGLLLPANARTLGFHDLGLYEFLYLALVVLPLFALWNRRARPTGFFLAAFAALYLPVRFAFDLLRVSDVRYAGLTPAQWVAAPIVALLPFVVLRRRKLRFVLSGAVILAAGWACWGGRH